MTAEEAASTKDVVNPVPYVADFTDPSVQKPTPRPFYCTRFYDVNLGYFDPHSWYIFALPETVTLPYPGKGELNEIYVDPGWQW